MQNKTLSDWFSYIETCAPQTTRSSLNHLKAIAEKLNIYPIQHPIITVTGTNGKGSCVALLTAILRNGGYKVGTYTSPHLITYHERIVCDNHPVTDEQLCAAFSLIDQQRLDVTLNYFEWITLAAFIIFKQVKLDVWILEVGIGGRLDPVNILDADLAIITSIAIDHINWLGNSIEQIGFEKSGIMRTNKPVICGDFQTPDSVKKYAKQISACLFCQNEDFAYSVKDNEWSWWNNSNKTRQSLPLPHLELQNASTILAAIEHLTPYFRITDENISYALTHTRLPGRFQIINGSIKQILDVAHNPAATALLAKRLAQETCHHRIHAVFAILNDKDHLGTIKPLIPLIHDWYIASLDIPRGSHANQLAEIVINAGARSVYTYDKVLSAYQAAMHVADPGDYVLIFGSFYIVAEVLRQL